jgi:acetate---CoA ligase (ADP-forming)
MNPLHHMLEARSVALVGASARPGSFGEQMIVQLVRGGFDGAVYPVNPRYGETLGLRCYPSLADVPEAVDLALLGVSNERLEEQLDAAARSGARSAVIFASCHDADVPGEPSLRERLAELAREARMALCGGNCMGFLNLDRRLRACGFSEPLDLEPGPIAFITHSGSAFSAMLHNDRSLRFNLAISTGQELTTSAAQYLEYALAQPSTQVVALFLEAVRDPGLFRAGLEAAAERDVPVVALKVGRTGAAREFVRSHSGAMAGEEGAFEALFDAYGVALVRTLDEMADTLELFAAGRRAGPGGLASVHDSGGERALFADLAADARVPFAAISEGTKQRLETVLEPGLPAVNPLDAWGSVNRAEETFLECIRAVHDDADTAAVAFCVDLTREEVEDQGYVRVARDAWCAGNKPMAIVSNLASAIDRRDAASLRREGIPVLEGTVTGLAAFGHLLALRDHRSLPPVVTSPTVDPTVRERWRERLRSGERFSEVEAFTLLSDYGIRVTTIEPATSIAGVEEAARRIGWPVALKTANPDVDHKSDAGGVILGLRNEDELRAAYEDLQARLGPSVVVAAMGSSGLELALGMVRDDQFGPIVMVATGGVLVEGIRDRRFALPPLDRARARALIDRLAVRPLLDGGRGRPPADTDALIHAVIALSGLATDLGHVINELDVNPFVAGPDGCVALDALILSRVTNGSPGAE